MATIQARRIETTRGQTVLIRSGAPSDAAAILKHCREVMAESEFTMTCPDELSLTEEQEEAWIQSHLDHPGHLLVVAEMEGRLVGELNFSCGHRRRIAHTGEFGMSVAKEDRDAGIGRALLATLIDWAKHHDSIEKVNLKVHATNDRAIALYRKMGFVEEGRAVRELKYESGQYVDALLMAMFV